MEQLFHLATKYYFEFESIRNHRASLKGIWFLSLIAGIGFILAIFNAFGELTSNQEKNFFSYSSTWLMLFSEVLFLALLTKLQDAKRATIIKKYEGNLKDKFAILRVKRDWIIKNSGLKADEFFDVAEKFDKMLTLYQEKKTPYENYWANFPQKLFSESSKARVLSLIVFLMSICFLLLTKGIKDSSIIIEIIQPDNLQDLLVLTLVVAFLLFIFIEAILGFFWFIKLSATLISIQLENKRSESNEIVRIFIKDLILLSRLGNKVRLEYKHDDDI